MNLTKITAAFAALVTWVRDGMLKKQNKVLVKTSDPTAAEGVDGDICVIVDG